METITIIDKNNRITVFLKNSGLSYISYNNSVDIKKYIELLKMKDPYKFFYQNGKSLIAYKNRHKITNTLEKQFKIKNVIVLASLSALLLLNLYSSLDKITIDVEESIALINTEFDQLYFRDKIFSSPNLTIEEKLYLYNEDFINDILPFINSSLYLKHKYNTNFKNVSIRPFDLNYERYESQSGYYSVHKPNELRIKDYKKINDDNKDTVAHEYIHLCQEITGYNLIIEASAEIISFEYFSNNRINTYYKQVRLLKILMEIIGSYPIWQYNFTGDFSLIEERVKPYLNSEEYNTFLDCLSFDYDNDDENKVKFEKLEKILSILYQNKYAKDMSEDEIIKHIDDSTLVRYYFNKRLNESYILDYSNMHYETLDLDTAIRNNLVFFFCSKKTCIDYKEIDNYMNCSGNAINREIDFNSNSIIIQRERYDSNKIYITCIIDGVKYDDIDIDELYEKGIIDIKYYLTEYKYLNAYEYINHLYDDDCEISISHHKDTIINDDYSVYARVPEKIYLPSFFEKENSFSYVKKMVY